MALQISLVGCGAIGKRHAQEIIQNNHKLAAVCDIDMHRAEEVSSMYNCPVFSDINSMIQQVSNIDVVSICTPNYLHAQQSIQCLQSGKHVLCEKPMAISTQDALDMLNASKQHGKKLLVVKQNRFNAPVKAVKQLLNEGKLGNIHSFQINCYWNRPEQYYSQSWRGKKATDGGTLFTQFSHFIDLMHWYLGDVAHIHFIPQNAMHPYIEFEDSGIISFQMSNGAIGSMQYNVNAFQKNMEGSFVLFGEKGTIKIGGPYLNTIDYQSIESGSIEIESIATAPNEYGTYQGTMRNHGMIYKELQNAIMNDAHSLADAFEGYKTVETIERIYSSI